MEKVKSKLSQWGNKGKMRNICAHIDEERKDGECGEGEVIQERNEAEDFGPRLHLGPAQLYARPAIVLTHPLMRSKTFKWMEKGIKGCLRLAEDRAPSDSQMRDWTENRSPGVVDLGKWEREEEYFTIKKQFYFFKKSGIEAMSLENHQGKKSMRVREQGRGSLIASWSHISFFHRKDRSLQTLNW